MEEAVIWVGGLAIELLLIAVIVCVVLLLRSRKAGRRLAERLAELEKQAAEHVVAAKVLPESPRTVSRQAVVEIAEPQIQEATSLPNESASEIAPTIEARAVDATVAEPPAAPEPRTAEPTILEAPAEEEMTNEPKQIERPSEPGLPKPVELSLANEFDELLVSVDAAKLGESVGRLQQRIDETTASLQRLASSGVDAAHPEVVSLQMNLKGMSEDVASLQQSNAQLQEDLQRKAQAVEHAASKARDNTEIVLQHAKKLRGDIATLRDKLQSSDADVQRLQAEKESLAAEYEALNKEYEQIYAHGKQ